MKHIDTILLALAALIVSTTAMAQTPAFPGAEGHGRYTTGGRGGTVKVVTTLNDAGPGSLREAVSGNAKKTIVFNVGGVIALSSDLKIGENTTILGQTAPAPGITLRYYTVNPGANNIIRYIRVRRGQERNVNDGADAITQRNITGLMLDHCSFSWSIDEVASFYDNNNFTMQWCTIAESLCNAGHDKGAHGYGGIWGGKLASFHHNLIAHVANRGPRFNGARYGWTGYTQNKEYATYKWHNTVEAENVDLRNCVMYEAQGTCYGGPGGGQINMVNNYYRAGDSGRGNQERITTVTVGAEGNSEGHPDFWGMTSRYFIEGNTLVKADGTASTKANWECLSYDSGTKVQGSDHYSKDAKHYYTTAEHVKIDGEEYVRIRLDAPAPTGSVTTHTAATAFDRVLTYAGASLSRDDVDTRYEREARSGHNEYTGSVIGKCGLIDVVADCNGYTEQTFGTVSRPDGYDTDADGMPDEWETAHGLNPNDPTDAKQTTTDPAGEYTNIEMYANSLVASITEAQNAGGTANYTERYPEAATAQPGGNTPSVEETTEIYSWLTDFSAANSVTFADGATVAITGNDTKTISGAKNITYKGEQYATMKVSNGAQNTFTAPAGKYVKSVTFASYVNKTEATGRDPFWAEVNGVTYTGPVHQSFQDLANPDIHTFQIGGKPSFTFTNTGEQLCYIMEVTYGAADASGVVSATVGKNAHAPSYNLQGQRVNATQRGIVITGGRKVVNK